jgi:hypothetical protein
VDDRTRPGLAILGSAAVLGLLGDLLLRATPWGLNVLIWVLALVGLAAAVATTCRTPLRGEGRWLAAPILLFAALFVWRDSDALAALNGFVLLTVFALAVMRSRSGRILSAGLSDYAYLGAQSLGHALAGPLPAAVGDVRWREMPGVGRGPALSAARGVLLAAPLLVVFGALFAGADAVFQGIVSDLFDFDLGAVWGHLILFGLFAWISAGLLRPALLGGELPGPWTERPRHLYLGTVEVGIVLGLLDALFTLFVAVQVRYLFGGGDVLLDTGLTYAEYARRGFFELVAVVALALPVLLAARWLLRPGAGTRGLALFRALAGLLTGLLAVVVASALWRMRLYTDEYGLTELRLYATAFVLWISAVLVWFVVTYLLRDLGGRFAAGVLVSGLLAAFLLDALNPDARIARNNIARFEAGERFDALYLTSLSADAVPVLADALPTIGEVPLFESELCSSPEDCEAVRSPTIRETILDRWSGEDGDWRTFNVSRSRARAIAERQAEALEAEPG